MEQGQEGRGREKGGKGKEKGEELHYTIEIQNFSETCQINLFLGSGFWEKYDSENEGGGGQKMSLATKVVKFSFAEKTLI